MEEIQYIGELLWPREAGHFFILLGFVSSLFAVLTYYLATQRRGLPEADTWKLLGRIGFGLHALSVLAVIGTIFYILLEKRYEYAYAQKVVSDDLPFKYVFSAFWQEQEGSFLLWSFWHVVLGGILVFRAKTWEAPVLAVLCLIEAFIASMILGIHITDELKIGSNPLLLLRDTMDIPLFRNADYVSLLKGNGLNPLLQNYWMTIHPPTLFLGFASTAIPFCYAVAALWTRQYQSWLKPAFPWALFSGAILGTGILMGGAWAYEALSFGGYWAWDPVENTSLVPWLVLVAGIHTHLIARNTGYSYKATFAFYLLTFLLILYSTFLTRSGVLGDTSVHAFTEMGLENQLLLFILSFSAIGLGLLILRRKEIKAPEKEESMNTREFWMFIGSLTLLFSSVLITASTSLPVLNKIIQLFKPEFVGYTLTDPVRHHNDFQLWTGIFIGLLSGLAQFLRYRELNWEAQKSRFIKAMAYSIGTAALLTVAVGFWIDLVNWRFALMTFSGLFTAVANTGFLLSLSRGRTSQAASVLSHLGFGLMLVGVIASGLNKQNISNNPMAQAGLLDDEMIQRNVLLFKDTPLFMNGYRVNYVHDTLEGNLRTFQVDYEKLDEQGRVEEQFSVFPAAVYNNEVSEVVAYNPSTKRYLDKDIFTHIATLPRKQADFKYAKEQEDSLQYDRYELGGEPFVLRDTVTVRGDTTVINTRVFLESINYQPSHPDYEPNAEDVAFGVRVGFETGDTTHYVEPLIYLRRQLWGSFPVQLNDLSLKVRLPEEALFRLLEADRGHEYKKYSFKTGASAEVDGLQLTFTGVDKQPPVNKQEGDVAIAAVFEVSDPESGKTWRAAPVFIIREGAVLTPKHYLPEAGLHLYLAKIDPATESFELMAVRDSQGGVPSLPLDIARKSYRTDYIVLEAIIFPGINLFWIGSILIMIGLSVAMVNRLLQNRRMPA